ncbi:hypothetical protein [Streptomyces sp. NPDC056987]|uniref:hypothetical protein n=1 Tax=Streptomyces sp. NPDC056987 TaxID=3345988 RepID=UPI0036384209
MTTTITFADEAAVPGRTVHRTTPLASRTTLDPPLRAEWEAYILRATHLLPHYKHLALSVAALADYTTGRIPDSAPTGQGDLMAQTGLAEYQVRGGLHALETRCLIRRHGDRVTELRLSLSSLALIRKALQTAT